MPVLIGIRLRRVLWRLRRLAVDAWGAAITAGAAVLIARNWFPDLRASSAEAAPVAVASALAFLVITKIAARLRAPSTPTPRWKSGDATKEEEFRAAKADLELGAALVVGLYVTLELTGAMRSPVYPLVYALCAFLITFHRAIVGLSLIALTLGLEYLLYRASTNGHVDPRARELMVSHLMFIGFFALMNLVFLQAEVMRQRREHRAAMKREIRSLREEARDFRLISSSLSADPKTRSRAADE
jgi:hypothetical protein